MANGWPGASTTTTSDQTILRGWGVKLLQKYVDKTPESSGMAVLMVTGRTRNKQHANCIET